MIYLPKSATVHPCLEKEKAKANGTYHCGEVLETLKNDFKNKCYICEYKEPTTINIEHFKPHKGDKELKFDWNNLFYCCGHCNSNKGARVEFNDILNCTVVTDFAETKIRYEINPFPGEKVKLTALDNAVNVVNTVQLLSEVYNGTTTLKLIESANIRSKLLKEIRYFQDLLFAYIDDGYTPEEKATFKNKIEKELRSSSGFTAFKRWIIRSNDLLKPDFAAFI